MDVRAQVIPITINYQLSVWTTDRVTNDALVREILFYYHLRPSLMVYVGHGLNIAHKFNIYFCKNDFANNRCAINESRADKINNIIWAIFFRGYKYINDHNER